VTSAVGVSRALAAALTIILSLAAVAFYAAPSHAANTRVSISDFRWSQDPSIDLNESVTWDWIGPDLLHSVTGTGPGGVQIDSDPGLSTPEHNLGDTFTVRFDESGQYNFQCKLHSGVRGTVTVSDQPGDPDSDPGPQPPIKVDMEAPQLDEVRLSHPRIGPRGRGGLLTFALSERGTADVEYFRVVRVGKRRWARRFEGYSEWPTLIGYNRVALAKRSPTFPAVPGRYVALLRATDQRSNTTEPVTLRFQINDWPKKKPAGRR
jgi:plastocyanin